jgi:oligopeptidase B
MLIANVLNQKSHLYKTACINVPSGDVLNGMLDKTGPLTALRYCERGNPEKLEDFNYLKEYSPYNNIVAKPYPDVLVTASFKDRSVGWHQAGKFVALLRETKTDENLLLLQTRMDEGHDVVNRIDHFAKHCLFILKNFGIESDTIGQAAADEN